MITQFIRRCSSSTQATKKVPHHVFLNSFNEQLLAIKDETAKIRVQIALIPAYAFVVAVGTFSTLEYIGYKIKIVEIEDVTIHTTHT